MKAIIAMLKNCNFAHKLQYFLSKMVLRAFDVTTVLVKTVNTIGGLTMEQRMPRHCAVISEEYRVSQAK